MLYNGFDIKYKVQSKFGLSQTHSLTLLGNPTTLTGNNIPIFTEYALYRYNDDKFQKFYDVTTTGYADGAECKLANTKYDEGTKSCTSLSTFLGN